MNNMSLWDILIPALLLGLIPAWIAKRKGHSFFAWWLGGVLFWIVALPLTIFALKPNRQVLDANRRASGDKQCPACAEWIRGEATVCRYCGRQQ